MRYATSMGSGLSASLRYLLFPLVLLLSGSCAQFINDGSPGAPAQPGLAKYAVFEGVLEPFRRVESRQRGGMRLSEVEGGGGQEEEVAWRAMKRHADSLASASPPQLQAALAEYGQLIRHPDTFSEMPALQRYDAFLSMARILKMMGHYQKAELLLFEALTHSEDPSEAHLQLALLYIDGEDLERAKVHIKNCLFHKEADVSMLVHLTVVLICQGRIQEAKFYTSRVLALLEPRVQQQQQHKGSSQASASPVQVHHHNFLSGIEELVGRVFHCEYRFVPSAATDLFRLFTSLHSWMSNGEMSGRFLFDLGQALYENGRPRVGLAMMRSGHLDPERGVITEPRTTSTEVVSLRTGLEFPPVPESVGRMLQSYVNITSYLVSTSGSFLRHVSLENIQDVYWPLPLLQGSGLPVAPVIRETLSRFEAPVLPKFLPSNKSVSQPEQKSNDSSMDAQDEPATNIISSESDGSVKNDGGPSSLWDKIAGMFSSNSKKNTPDKGSTAGSSDSNDIALLHKPKPSVKRNTTPNNNGEKDKDPVVLVQVGILSGSVNNHPVGHTILQRLTSISKARFRITLLALPLISSELTRSIVGRVNAVVNVPTHDVESAATMISDLNLDIILFPDWQPFPDQASVFFQSVRMAPVQICFYVRGSSCSGLETDYYIVPSDTWWDARQVQRPRGVYTTPHIRGHEVPGDASALPSAMQFWFEQVVELDWPVITPHAIRDTVRRALTSTAASSSKTKASIDDAHDAFGDILGTSASSFVATELEGRIFFPGQPVMVLAAHPTMVHPLMDESIFRILRAVPTLQLVIAVVDSFNSYATAQDASPDSDDAAFGGGGIAASPLSRRRMAWAGKLVRRLWAGAGSAIAHRIRLLPEALSSRRLYHLIQDADLVLDTFPLGSSIDLLAPAFYYGTPVVTMDSGVRVKTPTSQLMELRSALKQQFYEHRSNAIYQKIMTSDIPWVPCMSPAAAALKALGFGSVFVANSTDAYVRIASDLLGRGKPEPVYDMRAQLFDAQDRLPLAAREFYPKVGRNNAQFLARAEEAGPRDPERGLFVQDLERFLLRVAPQAPVAAPPRSSRRAAGTGTKRQ